MCQGGRRTKKNKEILRRGGAPPGFEHSPINSHILTHIHRHCKVFPTPTHRAPIHTWPYIHTFIHTSKQNRSLYTVIITCMQVHDAYKYIRVYTRNVHVQYIQVRTSTRTRRQDVVATQALRRHNGAKHCVATTSFFLETL